MRATLAHGVRPSRGAGWRGTALALALAWPSVLGGGTAAAQSAGAADDALVLSWKAPADCPNAHNVRQRIEEILGGPAQPVPQLAAEVEVWRDDAGTYGGRLLTQQGTSLGERELTGEDCTEVAHAVALMLALMVAPPAPEPAPPPTLPKRPAPPVAAEPRQGEHAKPRWFLRAGVQLGTGTLPESDAGVGAHFGAATRWISAELRAAAWLPRTASSSEQPGMGADLWTLAATPTTCLRWQAHRTTRLDSCAGVGITWLRATGFGMSHPSTINVPWGTARLEQAVAISLGRRVRLRPGIELSVALGRPVLAVENVGEIHRPSPIAVAGVMAAELAL